MYNGCHSVILWWIAVTCCSSTRLDVTLNHDNAGFFIKPVFRGEPFFSLNKEEKPFVITQNSRASSFEAQYGPFSVFQQISDPVGQVLVANHSSFGNGMILDDLEISAHLVSITIPQERPLLQILFHASHYGETKRNSGHNGRSGSCTNSYYFSNNPQDGSRPSCWCMQVHVQKDSEELLSSCVLSGDQLVCIAEVKIPLEWWVANLRSRSVNVYYSVYGMSSNLQCSTSRNKIVPFGTQSSAERIVVGDESLDKNMKTYPVAKRFVSSVSLSHGQLTYLELKEDQHILIYMPQKAFYPGAQFRVPVKLQVASHLSEFTIRVRCKHGLTIVGAEPSQPDTWQITLPGQTGDRRSAVTAKVIQPIHRDRIEEVFKWIFRVDQSDHEGHKDDESGRIIFSLEYSSGLKKDRDFPPSLVDNKVVAKVQIQHDNIYTIVPVIKTEEVINTAIITGKVQNFSLQIYAIGQDSQISDITKQTTCHSGDSDVLKVSSHCSRVYLDGTEKKGSPSVSVIANSGRHTKFLFFRVWVPDDPLDIELSDQRLSQIKTWRVPAREKSIHTASKKAHLLTDDAFNKSDDDRPCQLKFQQSVVEVYARFYYDDEDRRRYLVHRKAMFRVTDLVLPNLRVADQSVARLTGNVVEALQPGNTEIQVMSRLRAIGAKEIRVANDKVSLKELKVKVVSGVHADILPVEEIPGALLAHITTTSELVSHSQEAILDVTVVFNDDTELPLEYIPVVDYSLLVTSLNRHVIDIKTSHSPDTPKIIAIGSGQNNSVQVVLQVGQKCKRKKPLVQSYVDVFVDEFPLGEQPYKPKNNNGGKTRNGKSSENDPGSNKGGVPNKKVSDVENSRNGPNPEAQQQPVRRQREISPLEIGMYVLLGVFVVAIIVFAVNCVVFVSRHKKKRLPKKHKRESVSNANDWVWIGKDTLERNAINTCCNQALMSDQDFTVTRNVARFLLPQNSNPSSNRSSCATAGNGGSNRNSVISTYKGSECSIRITPNPIPTNEMSGDGQPSDTAMASTSNTVPRQRPAIGARPPLYTFHVPLRDGSTLPRTSHHGNYAMVGGNHRAAAGALSDIQSTSALSSSDERGSCSSLPSRWSSSLRDTCGTSDSSRTHSRVPTPLQQKRLAMVATEMAQRGPLVEQKDLLVQAAAQIAEREEDVANGNLTDSSVEWDYEAMGMTYEQLMEYFDNLKETAA